MRVPSPGRWIFLWSLRGLPAEWPGTTWSRESPALGAAVSPYHTPCVSSSQPRRSCWRKRSRLRWKLFHHPCSLGPLQLDTACWAHGVTTIRKTPPADLSQCFLPGWRLVCLDVCCNFQPYPAPPSGRWPVFPAPLSSARVRWWSFPLLISEPLLRLATNQRLGAQRQTCA